MWLSVFAYLCAVAHGSVLVGVLVSSPGFAGAYLAGRVLSVPAMAWVSRQSVGRQATAVWLSTLFQALTVYAFPGPGNDGLLAIALALVCGLTTMATGPMLEKGRELPHGHSLASARVSEYRRQTACTWVGLGCGGVGRRLRIRGCLRCGYHDYLPPGWRRLRHRPAPGCQLRWP